MKKWAIGAVVVVVVLALALGIGGFVKWDQDSRSVDTARSEASYTDDTPGLKNDAGQLQTRIDRIEKTQDRLRGVWLVSGSERTELDGKLAARKTKLESMLSTEMARRRGEN